MGKIGKQEAKLAGLCVRLCDAVLCDDNGTNGQAFGIMQELWGPEGFDDKDMQEMLADVNATDGRFYLPEDHPSFEGLLRQGC